MNARTAQTTLTSIGCVSEKYVDATMSKDNACHIMEMTYKFLIWLLILNIEITSEDDHF